MNGASLLPLACFANIHGHIITVIASVNSDATIVEIAFDFTPSAIAFPILLFIQKSYYELGCAASCPFFVSQYLNQMLSLYCYSFSEDRQPNCSNC